MVLLFWLSVCYVCHILLIRLPFFSYICLFLLMLLLFILCSTFRFTFESSYILRAVWHEIVCFAIFLFFFLFPFGMVYHCILLRAVFGRKTTMSIQHGKWRNWNKLLFGGIFFYFHYSLATTTTTKLHFVQFRSYNCSLCVTIGTNNWFTLFEMVLNLVLYCKYVFMLRYSLSLSLVFVYYYWSTYFTKRLLHSINFIVYSMYYYHISLDIVVWFANGKSLGPSLIHLKVF